MTLADIVDTSFRLFKSNWRAIAITTLIFTIPLMVVQIVNFAVSGVSIQELFTVDPEATTTTGLETSPAEVVTVILIFVFYILIFPFLLGVLSRIIAASYLGQKISAGDAIKGLLKKWPALLGATVLVILALVGILVVFTVPVVLIVGQLAWLLIFAVPFIAIALLVLGVFLSLVTPIIAVEESGAIRALNRSWSLVRRRFWPYLGTMLLVGVVAILAGRLIGGAIGILGVVLSLAYDPLLYPFLALETYISAVITTPLVAAGLTLIYFDSRIRHEGFDLEYAAQSPETPPPAVQ